MSFLIRPVAKSDLAQLLELAKQFSLLNLPGDKQVLGEKIERSLLSFSGKGKGANKVSKKTGGKTNRSRSEYLFVIEDTEAKKVVGSSLILAKHGTHEIPHHYFKILRREHFSKDLGVGFIHQVLRFQTDLDGPTEIGGLLVDRDHRKRPEKLGKQISLSRFLYMAMHREQFEDRVLCELAPPLTEEGRSEFWEALGRRFTGLPYQEADVLSQTHKEFITSLFPTDDIYLCLLESKARLVLGRVGVETQPAKHLLESIGFKFVDEVDPFDGGPHFGCATDEILPIALGKTLKVSANVKGPFPNQGLVATRNADDFRCALVHYDSQGGEIVIPDRARSLLSLQSGDEVFLSPFAY